MKVAAILSVYNGADYTLGAIAGLLSQSLPPHSIIVVDGGSNDGTAEKIAAKYPQVTVLRPGAELWWGEGMQLGVETALRSAVSGDFILAINNDVRFEHPDFLKELCASAADGRTLVGCLCRYHSPQGPIEGSGGRVDWRWGRTVYTDWMVLPSGSETIDDLDFLCSRATLIPAEVFLSGIQYDTMNFPQNLADQDLSYRAKRAGFSLRVTYRARLIHLHRPELMAHEAWFISYARASKLLNSIRSYYNLPEDRRFIELHCPKEYWRRNLFARWVRSWVLSYGRTFPMGVFVGVPARLAVSVLRKAHRRSARLEESGR